MRTGPSRIVIFNKGALSVHELPSLQMYPEISQFLSTTASPFLTYTGYALSAYVGQLVVEDNDTLPPFRQIAP